MRWPCPVLGCATETRATRTECAWEEWSKAARASALTADRTEPKEEQSWDSEIGVWRRTESEKPNTTSSGGNSKSTGSGALGLGPKTPTAEAKMNKSSTTDYQDYPKIKRKINSSHKVQEQIFKLKSNTIHTPRRSPSSLPHLIRMKIGFLLTSTLQMRNEILKWLRSPIPPGSYI
jgi:hypothetical protein